MRLGYNSAPGCRRCPAVPRRPEHPPYAAYRTCFDLKRARFGHFSRIFDLKRVVGGGYRVCGWAVTRPLGALGTRQGRGAPNANRTRRTARVSTCKTSDLAIFRVFSTLNAQWTTVYGYPIARNELCWLPMCTTSPAHAIPALLALRTRRHQRQNTGSANPAGPTWGVNFNMRK